MAAARRTRGAHGRHAQTGRDPLERGDNHGEIGWHGFLWRGKSSTAVAGVREDSRRVGEAPAWSCRLYLAEEEAAEVGESVGVSARRCDPCHLLILGSGRSVDSQQIAHGEHSLLAYGAASTP